MPAIALTDPMTINFSLLQQILFPLLKTSSFPPIASTDIDTRITYFYYSNS